MESIENRIASSIRNIPDFPQPGIQFKDITPLFMQPSLCKDIISLFAEKISKLEIDVIAGLETRGYLLGILLAQFLQKPFLIIRKAGKLPGNVKKKEYKLEYGTAAIEVQNDSITKGQKVLIHDDLLATGGTAQAAASLIQEIGGNVVGFLFLIELEELEGKKKLKDFSQEIVSVLKF